ncbi:hypothetical protein HALLA_10685 [Halostagnicola larsenii XH-48]|uniref:Uncharacterized protein n=1 Tax=Halostagnicola larsenii XH-48 TaxID=797299 RepID=W0JUA4_9EURY|nr:hypothetical protein [Halostagnicola larsenii]AHG00877.1 hypothetical protein HALLA_10685 [Halostagnicola larsenii XH-48]
MSETDSFRERTVQANEGLERVRRERRLHAVALGIAVSIGLVAASVHWFGLVLGGALLGLVSPTLARGVGYAITFGALVLGVFVLTIGSSVWPVLEMTPIVYVTVASAFGLPVFGSLVRGLG